MSTPTATTAGSSSKSNQKPSGPSNPSSANSPPSKYSSSPVEEDSQVREGQKSPAAIADVPTVMSESILRIIAGLEVEIEAANLQRFYSIKGFRHAWWPTLPSAEWKLYYQETGKPIRMFSFSISSDLFRAWVTLMRLFSCFLGCNVGSPQCDCNAFCRIGIELH